MVRRTLASVGVLLAGFHAWLLVGQVWDGHLAEPGLLLRWATAAGLAGALVALGRRGEPLVWGRKAVSLWLLAALLHGPALAGRVAASDTPSIPEAVVTVIQTAAVTLGVGLGLILLAGATAFGVRPHAPLASARPAVLARCARRGAPRFAPRPPPIRQLLLRW